MSRERPWIENTGTMPVPKGTAVDVKHADGDEFHGCLAGWGGSFAEVWELEEGDCKGGLHPGVITHWRLSE